MFKIIALSTSLLLTLSPRALSNPAAELTPAEEQIHFCWQSRWNLRNFRGPRDAAYTQQVAEMQRICTRAWHLTQQSMAEGQIPYDGQLRPQAYPFDPPLSWFTSPPRSQPTRHRN